MAEAEACRDGVKLIDPGDRRAVVAETDSLELVALWNSMGEHRSEISVILEDIQEITSVFSAFSLVHVRRSANTAAHLCAKFAS
ncbi:hypothetical protein BAE44_0008836 [Dichanthelium oligosanthes]|uniref:RNase H type-1 domain-containing protein n=1 Tax=Dichanthelium oligosanthes TaxID=888268 RepID=A0A1E5VYG1_9POAL|nr:hypothetical protein BAE44_0008836 [Dichanthelium oligosanthes]